MSDNTTDAARYRWLRAQHWTDGGYVVTHSEVLNPGVQTYSAENLDSVIDGALGTDQPQTMEGWRQTEIERLRSENERLRDIARRIGEARDRDHWNDLDEAVDELIQ